MNQQINILKGSISQFSILLSFMWKSSKISGDGPGWVLPSHCQQGLAIWVLNPSFMGEWQLEANEVDVNYQSRSWTPIEDENAGLETLNVSKKQRAQSVAELRGSWWIIDKRNKGTRKKNRGWIFVFELFMNYMHTIICVSLTITNFGYDNKYVNIIL